MREPQSSRFDRVKLADVVSPGETRDPRSTGKKNFTYVDIASVCNRTFSIESPKVIAGEDAPSRARKVIKTGDVLYATTRPYLKSIAPVPESLDNQICSTGFCVLRPTERILPEWLFYCATSEEVLSQITPLMRGATYPAVTDKDILGAVIPLPPIPEQCRIVSRIKECIERVEEIEELHQDVTHECNTLPTASKYDLWKDCEGGFKSVPLGDCVSSAKNGLYKHKKFHGTGSVLLRMFNIQDGELDMNRLERIRLTAKELSDFEVRNGDLVVSRVNSRELVGKSAVVLGLEEPAINEAMIIRLRLKREKADSRFLSWLINSPQFLHELRGRAKHAIGQSSINQTDLLSSKIPLPDLERQQEIIASAVRFLPIVRHLQAEFAPQGEVICHLRDAILRKAFAGEL